MFLFFSLSFSFDSTSETYALIFNKNKTQPNKNKKIPKEQKKKKQTLVSLKTSASQFKQPNILSIVITTLCRLTCYLLLHPQETTFCHLQSTETALMEVASANFSSFDYLSSVTIFTDNSISVNLFSPLISMVSQVLISLFPCHFSLCFSFSTRVLEIGIFQYSVINLIITSLYIPS